MPDKELSREILLLFVFVFCANHKVLTGRELGVSETEQKTGRRFPGRGHACIAVNSSCGKRYSLYVCRISRYQLRSQPPQTTPVPRETFKEREAGGAGTPHVVGVQQ